MTPFSISGLLAGISALSFGFFTLLRSSNNKIRHVWFVFKLSASVWGFGGLWIGLTRSPEEGLLAWRLAYSFGVIWIAPLFYHFISNFLELKNKRVIYFNHIIAFLFCLTVPSKLFFSHADLVFNSFYYARGGSIYPFFFAWWMGLVTFSHVELIRHMGKVSSLKREQIKYFIFATVVGYLGGCTAYLPNFGIDIYPWGNFTVASYPIIMSYAILRFKLMDMSLIIRWGIAYGLTVLVISILYISATFTIENLILNFLAIQKGYVSLIAACIAVLFFDPTRKKISSFIDKFIFKSLDYVAYISEIENTLNKTSDIESITNRLRENFTTIWNVSHVGFAIKNISTVEFQLFPDNAFQGLPIHKIKERITEGDFLVRTLESERRLFKHGIITRDEIENLIGHSSPGEKTTFSKIRRTMLWLGAAACIPLMGNESISGFIILGPKKDESRYSDEDKKFLSHVAQIVSTTLKKIFSHEPRPDIQISKSSYLT